MYHQRCCCSQKPHLHAPLSTTISLAYSSSNKTKQNTKEFTLENIQTIKKWCQHSVILFLLCLKDYNTMIKEIFHFLIYNFSFQVWNKSTHSSKCKNSWWKRIVFQQLFSWKVKILYNYCKNAKMTYSKANKF